MTEAHPTAEQRGMTSIRGDLIRLAAEIVNGNNMPSEHPDDWKWYRSTPIAERRAVLKQAEIAREQCRKWAIRLRGLTEELRNCTDG